MYGYYIKEYKKGKLFIICFIIFFTVIVLSFIFISHQSNKDKVEKIVTTNQDLLNECIQNKTYDQLYKIKGIKNITPYTKENNELYIDFYCYGFGIVPSSIYYGFYYSSNDKPMGFQAAPVKLDVDGNGWQWQETNGDNYYYTEKITSHWYYYKAGF
jgi:hypothetical protein